MLQLPWPDHSAAWKAALQQGTTPAFVAKGSPCQMHFFYGVKGVDETEGFEAGIVADVDIDSKRVQVSFPTSQRLYHCTFQEAAGGYLQRAITTLSTKSASEDRYFSSRGAAFVAQGQLCCAGDVFAVEGLDGVAFQVLGQGPEGLVRGRYLLTQTAASSFVYVAGYSDGGSSSSKNGKTVNRKCGKAIDNINSSSGGGSGSGSCDIATTDNSNRSVVAGCELLIVDEEHELSSTLLGQQLLFAPDYACLGAGTCKLLGYFNPVLGTFAPLDWPAAHFLQWLGKAHACQALLADVRDRADRLLSHLLAAVKRSVRARNNTKRLEKPFVFHDWSLTSITQIGSLCEAAQTHPLKEGIVFDLRRASVGSYMDNGTMTILASPRMGNHSDVITISGLEGVWERKHPNQLKLYIHNLQQHKQGSNLPLHHPLQSKRPRLSGPKASGATQDTASAAAFIPPLVLHSGTRLLQHLEALCPTDLDGQQAVTLVRGTVTGILSSSSSSGGGDSTDSNECSWWCGGSIGKADLVGDALVFPMEHDADLRHGAAADNEDVFAKELPWVLPAGYYSKHGFADDLLATSKLVYGLRVALLACDVQRLYRERSLSITTATMTIISTFEAETCSTWGWVADVVVECVVNDGQVWKDEQSVPLALVMARLAAMV